MERQIGEKFTDNGVELEVAKEQLNDLCEGCYYDLNGQCINNYYKSGTCFWDLRTDRTGIIFKQVENEQN